MFQDEELIQEFVIESCAHLAAVEGQLLEIESAGDQIDVDLVNTVFRAVHSVKGAAGFLGLTSINAVAHSLENVLNLIRNRELAPNSAIVNTLLLAADLLRELIEHVATSNDVDVTRTVESLEAIASNGNAAILDPVLAPMEATASDCKVVSVDVPFVGDVHQQTATIARSASSAFAASSGATHGYSTPSGPTHGDSSVAVDPAASNKNKVVDASIRVHVSVLDRLMNLAGELVLSRNQLLAAVGTFERDSLEGIANRVDQVTSELQETIMQTRMQPIGVVFGRFPRVVRDLSRKLGKECRLEIEGDDVEVDKTIVEALGDPLTHLVRNCIDHGIERPENRASVGKTREGLVRLRAFHQAGKVCIRIEDDGAGMDPNRLKNKALEKGIISPDQAMMMSDSESLRLIFAPGFSTASQVTDVSGRGVGMDVVRTNIEQLGGTVDIESAVGVGSAIHITLPLTLAIVPSMIVSCCGERYAIPQSNITELVRVTSAERSQRIGQLHTTEVLRLRGDLLPLIRLEKSLGLESDPGSRAPDANFLIIETGQLRYALQVDSIFDNEEIVVKPLGKHVRDLGYVAGATILGDGHVALILDVAGIASQSNLRNMESLNQASDLSNASNEEVHRLLLFSNHPEEQFAVPMAMVARIERIQVSEIQTLGTQLILVYRGQTLPVLRLEQHIHTLPGDRNKPYVYIIVFRVQNREIGLVAPQLGDIRDLQMQIDSITLREPGVLGTLVVEGQSIRVLDLVELVRLRYPDWGQSESPTQTKEPKAAPTVLLAEDSDFFRSHVTRTLENEGFTVIGASDGQDAWERLQSVFDQIDVIITDIEMPRMNGLEFAQAVRASQSTSALPIIALTSLATEDDRQRGSRVGINEYQVKMDPNCLVEAVRRLAGVHA